MFEVDWFEKLLLFLIKFLLKVASIGCFSIGIQARSTDNGSNFPELALASCFRGVRTKRAKQVLMHLLLNFVININYA